MLAGAVAVSDDIGAAWPLVVHMVQLQLAERVAALVAACVVVAVWVQQPVGSSVVEQRAALTEWV